MSKDVNEGRLRLEFLSDNAAPGRPDICAKFSDYAAPYGNDPSTAQLKTAADETFETPVDILAVTSGAASNAISMRAISGGRSKIYCHETAHIRVSEGGGPAWYSEAEPIGLPGLEGKIDPEALANALADDDDAVMSITNTTENGTVYTLEELRALTRIARDYNVPVHLDGARFANAVARIGKSPADCSWRSGIDIMSFGSAKNGGQVADAVVLFNPDFSDRLKKGFPVGGHRVGKSRYLTAELLTILKDASWVDHAASANRAADQLSDAINKLPDCRIVRPVHSNHVFVELPQYSIYSLLLAGYRFYLWERFDENNIRLMTNWSTTGEDIKEFVQLLSDALENPLEVDQLHYAQMVDGLRIR